MARWSWTAGGDALLLVACSGLALLATTISVSTPADVVPAVLPVLAAFVAAALASVRVTCVVALIAIISATLDAWLNDGRTGWSLASRIALMVVGGALAVFVAVLRGRRERELVQARHDLSDASLLRTLTETSRDPIFVKDREGRYLVANDATARAVGLVSGDDLIGRRDRDVVRPDVADWIEADDENVFRAARVEEFEDELETSAGTRTFLTHKGPLFDSDGRVVGLTAVSKDITIRKRALRALERSEQRLERIAATRRLVAEVASRVAVAEDLEPIAQQALNVLTDHLPAHSAAIVLSSAEEPSSWRALAFSGVPDSIVAKWSVSRPDVHTPSEDVATSGVTQHFDGPDSYKAAYPDLAAAIDAAGIDGPTILVPLTAGTQVLGTLSISFREPVDDATMQSVGPALEELGPVLGHSLQQAQFLELEARIASSFQQAMLELDVDPDPCLAVATTYQAGSTVLEAGGDWYDVVAFPDGRIALTVGDVVGRSLRAATVMGRLRAAMRALVLTKVDPAQVLDRLDELVTTIDDAQYATCACAIVDPVRSTVEYASAGHPPTVLLAPNGRTHLLEQGQGPPLGVQGRRPRQCVAIDIEPGSRLVLYTDGLIERRTESLDDGLERLRNVVEESHYSLVERVPGEVLRVQFADYEQQDDVAMICAEFISESADRFHRRLDADAAALRTARHALTYWAAAGSSPGTTDPSLAVTDAVLAISEALANAVEHGRGGPQSIDLDVTRNSTDLRAVVQDRGGWKPKETDPTRGRGLQIMRTLADDVDIDATATGTTVTMTLPLGDDRP
jgi:PAS domain S-box-containing protein